MSRKAMAADNDPVVAKKRRAPRGRVVRLPVVAVAADYPAGVQRPRTRAECENGPRPCGFVSCRFHLALDYIAPDRGRTGPKQRRIPGLRINFPDSEIWELEHTCALDIAADGAHSYAELGTILGITKQGVEKLIERALLKLANRLGAKRLLELLHERGRVGDLMRRRR